MRQFSDKVSLIWDIADTLRGPYRPPEYRKVMLPMTVLRRLDCVLEPTKEKVLETQKQWGNKAADALLRKAAKQSFYNTHVLALSTSEEHQLREKIENGSQNPDDYTALASLLFKHGRFDESVSVLRYAVEQPLPDLSRASLLTSLGWFVNKSSGSPALSGSVAGY